MQVGVRGRLSAVAVACVAALSAEPATAAPVYPDAVVMVSGYNSSTAFTTPDPVCASAAGDTWSDPAGPAGALRAAGLNVFTAPVHRGMEAVPAPCAPGGAPVPGAATEIDSFGDNDLNGAALAGFLDFLRSQYGVQRVQLVAHSDGGNWSRAALTQGGDFGGLEVLSLTTLGTPYTGSMVADLGTEVNNGKCDFSNEIEQDLCEALLEVIDVIYDGVGPTAVRQLTSTYLESWNEEQRIGSCPVTTIAGTGLSLPLIPFTYYNPSDGLVGEASALAHSAFALPSFDTIPAPPLPGLRFGGTYPVVHAPALSFISAANLLNTPAVSADVADIVAGIPAGPACNAPAATLAPDRSAESFVLALREHEVPSPSGNLGRTSPGDLVVARSGTRLRCGRSEQSLIPLLGDPRASIAVPDGCRGPLRVSGPGSDRRRALLVSADPSHDVVAKLHEGRIRVRVRGGADRLRARLKLAGAVRPLRLDERGWASLPQAEGSATLIVRVGVDGRGLQGAAVLAL